MKTKHPVAAERRRFLKGMAATGGVAVMAPQATPEATAATPDAGPEQRSSKGYRLTAHIREYDR